MSNTDSIIEKIRALLRLARSDNPHEAALAMQRAHEIATKHQLELASISPDDDIHKILGRYMDTPSRLAHEWKESLNVAHGFFNVHVTTITRSGRCLIVGSALDIELAEYVITFLVRACRQCLAAWKESEAKARRKTTGKKIGAWIDGFFLGVSIGLIKQQRAAESVNAAYALALSNGRQARRDFSHAELGGTIRTITMPTVRRDARSLSAGFQEGRKTQINPGLRGSGSTLALG